MQEIDSTLDPSVKLPKRRGHLRRFLVLYLVLFVLIVTVFAVPLININRYQHRIIASLSESLGRPIHLDQISLTMFPLPGLTITNLTVGEDPAFGAEPFIRASSVQATLRISSLWRRRIEFTQISFTDPSINLVHTSNGKWNLENILLQASRLDAAPTAQRRAGQSPRFPYIEASGARLNLKLDQEKMPVTLTEADIALWLHTPQQWRLRVEGRPLRTDTNITDPGTFTMEGTLGRSTTLNSMPIDLKAEWQNAPLGEASRFVFGQDAGLRGSLSLSTSVRGTVGQGAIQTNLHLDGVRSADFVPAHTLSIQVECQAMELDAFRSLDDLRCSWPPALTPGKKIFALTGEVPDLRQPSTLSFDLGTPGIPAPMLLDWLHIANPHINPLIKATGTLTGSLFRRANAQSGTLWGGQFTLSDGSFTVPSFSSEPVFDGDMEFKLAPSGTNPLQTELTVSPVTLTLGGRDFATLEGSFDRRGYSLHLTGTAAPAKLLKLARTTPLGDGLAEILPEAHPATPLRFDYTSECPWGSKQTWQATPKPSHKLSHR